MWKEAEEANGGRRGLNAEVGVWYERDGLDWIGWLLCSGVSVLKGVKFVFLLCVLEWIPSV